MPAITIDVNRKDLIAMTLSCRDNQVEAFADDVFGRRQHGMVGLRRTSVSTNLLNVETFDFHQERKTDMARLAKHPGAILANDLQELGVTPTELSRQINVPPNRVTQIIKGQRNITGDTALRLGHWFSISAKYWLDLQSEYDISVAEQAVGEEIASLPSWPRSSKKTELDLIMNDFEASPQKKNYA